MIYLTTGTNGAGKTLLTLWDVRQQQVRENRPVFYRGFTPKEQLAEWGWKEFVAEEWQALPDGSICIFDEAQEVFPTRGRGEPPQWIADIAKYRRKRGFDFWIVTPHPSQIDIFVRRLIEKPSFHRHLKRAYGAQVVSQLLYGYVELQCEKPESGKNAEISIVPYRKEVFEWYSSASLHTVKRKLPRAFWVFAATIPIGIALIYFAVKQVAGLSDRTQTSILKAGGVAAAPVPGASAPRAVGTVQGGNSQAKAAPQTTAELAASYVPRFPGLPYTAVRYDELTKPVTAPFPAACIYGTRPGAKKKTCECFTQQGTRLVETPFDMCVQIATNGIFVDWQSPTGAAAAPAVPPASAAPAPAGAIVIGSDSRPHLSAPGDTGPVFAK